MVAFVRDMSSGQYLCKTELLPLESVANVEKKLPREWITAEGNGITQDFIDYALPLIQGQPERALQASLPRFAQLKKVLVE